MAKKSNKQIILEEAKKAGLSGSKLDHFVAQMFAESGGWKNKEESAYFQVKAMREKFSKAKGKSDEELKALSPYYAKTKEEKKKREKKFFDYFYGDRMGNEGEGYRYRGRGPIQLTGKENYKKYGADPDKMDDLRHAAAASARYFADKTKDLSEDADVDDFTKAVNPGTNKEDFNRRRELYNKLIDKKNELKSDKASRSIDSITDIEQPKQDTELAMSDIDNMSLEELEAEEAMLLEQLQAEGKEEDIDSMSLAELEQEEARLLEEMGQAREISQMETFGIRAANAALFDFGDEIAAGAEAAFTDKPYDQALKENREYLKELERANPGTALAADIAGGVAGSLAGAGVFNSAFKIGKLANLGGNARNILIGAQEGAIAALGKTEEDKFLAQMEDALAGGGIGLLGGAAGSAISKGIGGVKKEMLESGEELIDRSMGIYTSGLKKKFVSMLNRKGIGKDEMYDTIRSIKLEDGTPVFSAADNLETLNMKLAKKHEEFSDAYQKIYNVKSNEIGPVIDPEAALDSMKARFVLDNEQVTKDLMNPRLSSTFNQAKDVADLMPAMFAGKDKMTLGQLHASIKGFERELMKKYGVKSYFQLDDTAQSALTSARSFLEDSVQAHLSPEEFADWKQLQKGFNITKEYGKLVQTNNDYTNKGAVASMVKTLANSTFFSTAVAGSTMMNPRAVSEAIVVGTGLRRVAQSPTTSKVLGESMNLVGTALSKGQVLDGTMKRLVNAATRSVEDFEVEVEHEAVRLQGGLPTEEERQAEEAFIKNSDIPVRNKLEFIGQARQGIKPNYEQDVQPPVYNPPQFAPRDASGKKVDREDEDFSKIMGKTQVREIMP